MGAHVAQELVKALLARKAICADARVLVMGFTFKENCADTRNTRVADIGRDWKSIRCRSTVTTRGSSGGMQAIWH